MVKEFATLIKGVCIVICKTFGVCKLVNGTLVLFPLLKNSVTQRCFSKKIVLTVNRHFYLKATLPRLCMNESRVVKGDYICTNREKIEPNKLLNMDVSQTVCR